MAGLANYCPDEVDVLLAGFIPVKGFLDGTFIEITKDVQPFQTRVSADGQVMRLYQQSDVYTLTLTLMSTSETNDVLTKLWQLDEITQKGKFPVLVKDKTGTDLFFSTTSWVEVVPGIVKSNNIEGRSWTLKSIEASINIGGNISPSGLIQDLSNMAVSALPSLGGIF